MRSAMGREDTDEEIMKCVCCMTHLVMRQCVQPLPVTLNFGGDILILENNAGDTALTPFCRERQLKKSPVCFIGLKCILLI